MWRLHVTVTCDGYSMRCVIGAWYDKIGVRDTKSLQCKELHRTGWAQAAWSYTCTALLAAGRSRIPGIRLTTPKVALSYWLYLISLTVYCYQVSYISLIRRIPYVPYYIPYIPHIHYFPHGSVPHLGLKSAINKSKPVTALPTPWSKRKSQLNMTILLLLLLYEYVHAIRDCKMYTWLRAEEEYKKIWE